MSLEFQGKPKITVTEEGKICVTSIFTITLCPKSSIEISKTLAQIAKELRQCAGQGLDIANNHTQTERDVFDKTDH